MRIIALVSIVAASIAAPALGQVEVPVYDVGVPGDSGGSWASSGVVTYDDVTLGGPGVSGPVLITRAAVAVIMPPSPTLVRLYARVSFYPDHDSAVPGTALPYAGTPVAGSIDLANPAIDPPPWPGTLTPQPVAVEPPLLLDETNVFSGGAADRTAGLKVELFRDAAMTQYADGWQVARRANMPNPGAGRLVFPVGSSDYFGWFSGVGPIISGDITNSQRSGGTETNNRATYVVLYASYTCGSADFDGDGDAGTDADIEAFFACLAGTCCATCWPGGSDFDTDGDSGTDADVEAFFRVLAGGSC